VIKAPKTTERDMSDGLTWEEIRRIAFV